eukprot:Protomagalhaensia_wolfi_Nauph_80__3674@NODE_3705_length_730_cov_190_848046_g2919_i0_p1_GENE_NODE_3705_length_730_cov_190_848046_g2919_i0NODE_3705_length_730_cov_190_848046_g2919_i0_p1_ORF_typecomplete_len180_score15_83_NODE_3705_length_730_cov_190_848046_g2919_i0149688
MKFDFSNILCQYVRRDVSRDSFDVFKTIVSRYSSQMKIALITLFGAARASWESIFPSAQGIQELIIQFEEQTMELLTCFCKLFFFFHGDSNICADTYCITDYQTCRPQGVGELELCVTQMHPDDCYLRLPNFRSKEQTAAFLSDISQCAATLLGPYSTEPPTTPSPPIPENITNVVSVE